MTRKLEPLDWIVIAVYCLVTLGIGLYFARRASKNTGEFFLGGRSLPWWLAGTSMVATSFAADTPLYVTGIVRAHGVYLNWIWWSLAVSHMFSLVFLARMWRRAEVVTDVELADIRYSGKSASFLRGFRGLVMGLMVNSIVMAWVFLAGGMIVEVVLGIDPSIGIPICVGFSLLYAGLAGIWGVVVTDLVQFAVALGGAVLLAVLSVNAIGGLDELSYTLHMQGFGKRLALLPQWPEGGLASIGFWETTAGTLLIYFSIQWWAWKNSDGGGALIQRMSACRDERQSFLAVLWFNIAHYCIRPWPWILVALASLILLPDVSHEKAYPMMMMKLLPTGLLGLMFASLLAAFMSTIDTFLNLSAAYLVNDVYRPFMVKDKSDSHYVWVSRFSSLLVALIALLIASRSKDIRTLFHFMMGFGSGVGVVYLLRWFWWRISAASEIAGLMASTVMALLLAFHPVLKLIFVFPTNIPAITLISGVVWIVVTFLTEPVEQEKLLSFYRKVRPLGFWGPIREAAGDPEPDKTRACWLIAAWLGGSTMILAGILSTGYLLLGQHLHGMLILLASVGGGYLLWIGLRNSEPLEEAA